MALQAQGWCGFNGIMGSGMSQGQWCHGRGDEDGTAALGTTLWAQEWHRCTVSRARGGRLRCGLGNGVAGLGTTPARLMMSLARVEEDGTTSRGSTVVEK
jgi:hypothetical protein